MNDPIPWIYQNQHSFTSSYVNIFSNQIMAISNVTTAGSYTIGMVSLM